MKDMKDMKIRFGIGACPAIRTNYGKQYVNSARHENSKLAEGHTSRPRVGMLHVLHALHGVKRELSPGGRQRLLVALALCALLASSGFADVVTETPETWNSGFQGWTNTEAFGVSLSNPDGYLRMAFAAQEESPPPGEDYDLIRTWSTPATSMFVGNYVDNHVRGASFSFLAEDVAPADLELRFGVATNAHVWSYNLAAPTVGEWTDYAVNFDYSRGWADGPGVGSTEFWADLENVAWIGLYIGRNSIGAQDYRLDEFMLYNPEPSEIYLLLAALSGLAVFVRRRSAVNQA
ncbi:MAG: PEP-CTERM sorting domain-containing protein [Lentisphaerales bacterium]|nr:MAG: PEP-CTERM sorting domain-containing protein [Lentisphaerales bacterium]